ncbi:MAG: carboxypeptidase regulatory-like domain-containing protein [Candidatus Metalachnospira sp.]|nr:carboxypeptidase regulatory-like domain-containing protein [Candidatus Metalachnospira sp.]
MFIHDIYVLKESDPFEIRTREEVSINLELEKVPPYYHTLLSGKILHKCSPIKNASVMVLDANCSTVSSTLTDENGNYRFHNKLKPGKYKVIASAIGYNTSNAKTILIRQNSVTYLSFALKKSTMFVNGIVYGKILESGSRNPIEKAIIYLKSSENDCETIYKTMSNHSGQYLIYNILPNNYKMIVKKQGYMVTEPLKLKIEKQSHIILYIDLLRDSNDCKNTISGIITFEGNPIPEVAVFLYLLDTQGNEEIVQIQETNENGLFLFSNVESGHYLVKGKLQNSVVYEQSFTIE